MYKSLRGLLTGHNHLQVTL